MGGVELGEGVGGVVEVEFEVVLWLLSLLL